MTCPCGSTTAHEHEERPVANECSGCHGTGRYLTRDRYPLGRRSHERRCGRCGGWGATVRDAWHQAVKGAQP